MQIIYSEQAPTAIGPYSQAIRTGNLLYCSGQTPIVPQTMQLTEGGIEEQTRQVLQNLEVVLTAAGLSLRSVVKTNVFITDMGLFAAMNAVYKELFGEHQPARSTIAVKGLPMNALVEIECIAEFN